MGSQNQRFSVRRRRYELQAVFEPVRRPRRWVVGSWNTEHLFHPIDECAQRSHHRVLVCPRDGRLSRQIGQRLMGGAIEFDTIQSTAPTNAEETGAFLV